MINWNKVITPKNILIALLVLALLYLLTCRKKTEVAPIVKPNKELVKATVDVDAVKKLVADSFNTVLNERDKLIKYKDGQYDDLMAQYLNDANDFRDSLANKKIPDTCKPYQLKWLSQYNQLQETSNKKDQESKSLISNLKKQNLTQSDFLKKKDLDYTALHKILDTCIDGHKKLEDYTKKLKRNEIGIGVTTIGNYLDLKPEVGVNLYLRTKKGFQIEVGYFTNNLISIGLKKTLFKF